MLLAAQKAHIVNLEAALRHQVSGDTTQRWMTGVTLHRVVSPDGFVPLSSEHGISISQKMFTDRFAKVPQIRQSSFSIIHIKNKLTTLCGNGLLRSDLETTSCETNL